MSVLFRRRDSMKPISFSFLAAALALSYLGSSALAAEPEKGAEPSRAELQRKLDDAQKRLDVAAREVAELSMSLSDGLNIHRGFTQVHPQRAALGIAIAAQGTAGTKGTEGVPIESVSPGGGAAQAGLRPGDVLMEVNGEKLISEEHRSAHDKLLELMSRVEPNAKVKARYRRDGKLHDAQIEAQPIHDHFFRMAPSAAAHPIPGPLPHVAFFRAAGVFGNAELVALTPKLGQYFGTDKGLLVVRAPDDSRLKLEEGDVLLDIDGRTPSSPSHALRILSSYQGGEKLRLSVMRAKKKQTFEITVPEGTGEGEFEHHLGPGAAVGFDERMRMPPPPPRPAPVIKLKKNAV
jgi:hypothetical protein